jgi:hypothetical protein
MMHLRPLVVEARSVPWIEERKLAGATARGISLIVGVAWQGEVMDLEEVDEDAEMKGVQLQVDDLFYLEE